MRTKGRDSNVLDRMVGAVERVRERLLRARRALDYAGVQYALIGGNAVAAWVATVDESAIRNTQDVDILVRRDDLNRVSAALQSAGFCFRHVKGIDLFLDGSDGSVRDAIHVVFAGEKVLPEYEVPAPDVSDCERLGGEVPVLSLRALVRMKLTSFRRKDQVHLLDLMSVGLLDETFLPDLPSGLADRLRRLLDDPEG